MKEEKLCSFIVPVYNVENYVERCINSICKQDYMNIEIIIVDDGSTDKSGKIIDSLAQKDHRINIFHKKNEGVSIARNFGLSHAKGDIILFIDADDYIDEDYASYFIDLINNKNCDVVMNYEFYNVKSNNQTKKENFLILSSANAMEQIYYGKINVAVWNKAYKRNFLEKYKILFDKNIWYGEGMLFNIECLQHTKNIVIGNKRVYHQTWNPNSAMRNFNLESNHCGIKSLYLQKKIWENNKNIERLEIAWEYHLRCFNRSILVGIIKTQNQQKYFEEYKKKVGLRLKYFRTLRGLSQAQLAEKIKMEEKYISKIENGHQNISLETIYRFSTILNTDSAKFFTFED